MNEKKRIHIKINGVVQGVGFRPFLHRAAQKYKIGGWVRNTQDGVELEAEEMCIRDRACSTLSQ